MYNKVIMGAKKTIINWEANEYIQREKGKVWYVIFAVIVLAFIALTIWLKDWSFLALVVVCAVALLLYVIRPPRKLHYTLDNKGLTEGNHLYPYSDFKSFGVLKEGSHYCIVLTPKKRFSLRNNVYFPETMGEEIVDQFGERLPMEPVKLDLIDQLIRILRI